MQDAEIFFLMFLLGSSCEFKEIEDLFKFSLWFFIKFFYGQKSLNPIIINLSGEIAKK